MPLFHARPETQKPLPHRCTEWHHVVYNRRAFKLCGTAVARAHGECRARGSKFGREKPAKQKYRRSDRHLIGREPRESRLDRHRTLNGTINTRFCADIRADILQAFS